MPDTIENSEPRSLPPPQRRPRLSRGVLAATALVGVLVAGAALGAGGSRIIERWQPRSVMLLQPAPIGSMKNDTPVAIAGEVAEIFGNKFVLQDASGRALVDTGPRGERRQVVVKGESVTIQGRFDRGVVRADVLARADGRNEAFGPPGPPHDHGPKGPKDGPKERMKDGPRDRPGPRAEAPPPPPADAPDASPVR